MKLLNELKKINQYIGTDTDKFNEYYTYLVAEHPSKEEKKQIDDYIELSLLNFTTEIGKAVDEIGKKVQLMKISEMELVS